MRIFIASALVALGLLSSAAQATTLDDQETFGPYHNLPPWGQRALEQPGGGGGS